MSIPTAELHGYIYVADSANGNVLMSEMVTESGDIIDVEIIAISDDFCNVTISSETAFEWGMTECTSFTSLRAAYLEYVR